MTAVKDTNGKVLYRIGNNTDITERKRAEEELRHSEQRYRFLADLMPQIVWTARPDGYLDYYNKRWYEFTGFVVGAGGDDSWKPVLHPNDVELCLTLWYESVGTGGPYEIEYRFFDRQTESYRWHLGRALPMRDETGEIVMWAGTSTDIHDYKQAQQSLLQTHERLELLVQERTANLQAEITERTKVEAELHESKLFAESIAENSTSIIYVFDLDTMTNVYANKDVAEFLGYGLEKIQKMGSNFLPSVVHPDDMPYMMSHLEDFKHVKDGEVIEFEMRVKHVSGEWRWLWNRETVFKRSGGSPCQIMGTAQDITERKRVEESLERERRQLREIIATAPVAIAMFDNEMRYLAHSQQWLIEHSLEGQSLLNRSHYEVIPDLPEHWKAVHQRVLQGEAISNPEDILERSDGSSVYWRWAVHPWRCPEGEVGGIVIVTDMINELVEAREAALEASQFKSRFLANMSHEIRTPMNAVLGMTGLLLETSLNPEQRDFLETIRISGDALLSLINEILDLSKLEAGEMALETLDFDLSTCIEEVLELLAPQAHSKGLEIAALIEHNVPTYLQGDVGRLRQILMNLIGNAIKFTSAGEVVVQVQLRSQTPTEATIHFAVIDTGLGIAPEDQRKLFAPFIQVDASTTRNYGGTGLGLAICKQLVTLMAGEIGVESQLGQGSQFWFVVTLPLAPPTCPVREHRLLTNRRLLVVDDNATNRQVIYHQATRWGMQVQAESGAAALIALQEAIKEKTPYDVVLIDMQMLQSDGLVGKIKANSAIAQTPLIVLTSTHQRDKVQRVLQVGFAAYLVKPVKPSRLLDTIMSVLGGEQPSDNACASDGENLSAPKQLSLGVSSTQSKLRILLAEDVPVNQKVALKQLLNLGYSADVAANGQEVLQLLAKIPYDLILMDCQMPVLDGLATTREIHQLPENFFASGRRPVVVAMTANAMKEDQLSCQAAGMDDYLGKPVLKNKLAAVLERWNRVLRPTTTALM